MWCPNHQRSKKRFSSLTQRKSATPTKWKSRFQNSQGLLKLYMDNVNHPNHYGGKDNPYEAIKVIEAWDLGFHLGNVVKYISRAGKKGDEIEDLKKALFYLQRYIETKIHS